MNHSSTDLQEVALGLTKACAMDAADKVLLPATFKAMEDLMKALKTLVDSLVA